MIRSAPVIATLAVALAGCATSPPLADGLPATAPRAIELDSTPYFPQDDYQCGPAALATLLVASGVDVAPGSLTPEVYLPERRGSLSLELVGAARRHGRCPTSSRARPTRWWRSWRPAGRCSCCRTSARSKLPRWHYAVLIGYDADRNVAVLRSGRERRLEMKWQRFAGTWHRGGRFAMTTLRPDQIPDHAEPERFVAAAAGLEAAGQRSAAAAAYDAAIMRWPREPHAWLGRGNVAYADGDRAAAADAWSRAIMLDPANAAARNNLAELLLEAGCLDESRRQIERASALAQGTASGNLTTEVSESRSKIERAASSRTGPGRTERAQALGGTLALRRNRFIGSYLAFSATRRSKLGPKFSRCPAVTISLPV